MLEIVPPDQVLHDASAFKDPDRFAIGEGIHQCRDAAIGVDIKKPLFLLRVLGDINLGVIVRKTRNMRVRPDRSRVD